MTEYYMGYSKEKLNELILLDERIAYSKTQGFNLDDAIKIF